jgi:hypothetical protein
MHKYCPTHGIVDHTHTHGRWAGGSTRAWRKKRAEILKQNGHCTEPGCNQPATEVHHVDDFTLRSVCAAHNPRGG